MSTLTLKVHQNSFSRSNFSLQNIRKKEKSLKIQNKYKSFHTFWSHYVLWAAAHWGNKASTKFSSSFFSVLPMTFKSTFSQIVWPYNFMTNHTALRVRRKKFSLSFLTVFSKFSHLWRLSWHLKSWWELFWSQLDTCRRPDLWLQRCPV